MKKPGMNKGGLKVGKLGDGNKSNGKLGATEGRERANIRPKGGTPKTPGADFHSGGRS